MKSKVLYVSAHVPSAKGRQAGEKTAFANLLALSREYLVDVVVFSNGSDDHIRADIEELNKISGSVIVIRTTVLKKILGLMLGIFFGVAFRFSTRLSLKAIGYFNKLNCNSYSFAWLEFSQVFWVALFLPKKMSITLSFHDLQVQVVSRKKSLETLFFLGWTYMTERRFLGFADKVTVPSRKDAELIGNIYDVDENRVEVVRPSLSDFVDNMIRSDVFIEPYSILFWGAMNRKENYLAAIKFIKENFTELLKEFPLAKLYIVGASPHADLIELSANFPNSVIVTGYVEDPTEYFVKCSIGVAPLLSGAGVKVKVLEMIRAGIPVVSTPVGAEGIEKNELLISVPLLNFNNKIRELWKL